jgi:hypothetical protein
LPQQPDEPRVDEAAWLGEELGPDYHDQPGPGRKTRDKIRQPGKLNPGMTVTLTPRPERGEQSPAA